MKKEFLDLGRQPIANKFLKEDEISDYFFFDLNLLNNGFSTISNITSSDFVGDNLTTFAIT